MAKDLVIDCDELCNIFDYQYKDLPNILISKVNNMDTTYRNANIGEFKEYILYVLKKIEQSNIVRTVDENLHIFEKGWSENLDMLICMLTTKGDPHISLKPGYFNPNKFLRYNKKLIVSKNLYLEHDLFTMVRYLIFNKYLYPFNNIYELGCGSCQNLYLLSELFPYKKLFGLDWTKTSVKIANILSNRFGINIEGIIFDMTNPSNIVLEPNSAIITVHSLEQIGDRYEKLISFIIRSKPGIVIHYEPILEFYDDNDILDYLAIMYSQKRNYLQNFYNTLCSMEKNGDIEILCAKRPYIGGIIHESSLIAWKPK